MCFWRAASRAGRIGTHLLVLELGDEKSLRVHRFMMRGTDRWSVTDETAPVSFVEIGASGSLAARMAELAVRCPLVYGIAVATDTP